ncbi:MAG: dUTP diphosphatase [Candidatus Roizmanbacteria bacterium]
MNIKIKYIDTTLPASTYQTEGSVAIDLYARVDTVLKPRTPTLIPLNVVIKCPKDHFFLITVRSSTAFKKGFTTANGIGVLDQDYCGDNDEALLLAFNFTDNEITVKRGDRIAQGIFVKISRPQKFDVVVSMNEKDRGGVGSTG